ncbi:MAG: hypothetical protein AAGI71_16550 [Bacteroidota bacterium]
MKTNPRTLTQRYRAAQEAALVHVLGAASDSSPAQELDALLDQLLCLQEALQQPSLPTDPD